TSRDENGVGWIRNLPVSEVQRYMKELLEYIDTQHPDIPKLILEKKELTAEIREKLDRALASFRDVFQVKECADVPALRDIRWPIASIKNMQHITRPIRRVSAAKLRRAQAAILSARPYAEKIEEVLGQVVARTEELDHPLLRVRPVRRVELVVMTSDRGLAGAFNSNITRLADRFLW